MGFCSQTKALLRKECLLWKRNIIRSITELIFVWFLMALIVLLRNVIPITEYNGAPNVFFANSLSLDIQHPAVFSMGLTNMLFAETLSPRLKTSHPKKSIKESSSNTSYVEGIGIVQNSLTLTTEIIDVLEFAKKQGISIPYKVFSTSKEMKQYASDPPHEYYGNSSKLLEIDRGIEILSDGEDEDNEYHYIIYAPKNYLFQQISDNYINTLQSAPQYDTLVSQLKTGFSYIQTLLDNMILKKELSTLEKGNLNYGFVPLESNSYKDDDFQLFLQWILPFCFLLSFLIPLNTLILKIMNEKESRMRDTMKMMGLKDSTYFFSYFIFYALLTLVYSLGGTGILYINVYTHSNFFLVFLFFFLYGLSCFPFGILTCAFFQKPRVAAIIGPVVYYLILDCMFPFVRENMCGIESKVGLSVFPQVAMALGVEVFSNVETMGAGVDFTTIHEYKSFGFSLIYSFIFFIVDFIIFLMIALYFDNVCPGPGGIKKPWNYFLKKSYWVGYKPPSHDIDHEDDSMSVIDSMNVTIIDEKKDFEEIPENLKMQALKRENFKIRGLTKRFGKELSPAVNGIDLDMYSGQIFALLGHNGAGKTTTISMLTGLLAPTSGSAEAFGVDVFQNPNQMRKMVGLAPQHDVLFEQLTVQEHLEVLGTFKAMTIHQIHQNTDKLLQDFGLYEKKKFLAKHLSGGQKRRLSVVLAFLGNPKLVLLDEPTSGMDTTGRRDLWMILKEQKKGRIIILTTHYMDEADFLGDRIGIMSFGKMKCCGSSLYLKSRFGIGYNLHIMKKSPEDSEHITQFVFERIFDRDVDIRSDVGIELIIRLPFSSSHHFQQLFNDLDQNLEKLRIESYGISVTTLEDVFLRVGQVEEDRVSIKVAKANQNYRIDDLEEDEESFSIEDAKKENFCAHFLAIVKRRLIEIKRSPATAIFELLIPLFFMLFGIGVFKIVMMGRTHTYSIEDFPSPQRPVINTMLLANTDRTDDEQPCNFFSEFFSMEPDFQPLPQKFDPSLRQSVYYNLQNYSDIAYKQSQIGELYPYRYGGYLIYDIDSTNFNYSAFIYYNLTNPQSLFAFTNFLSNKFLQKATSKDIKIKATIAQMDVYNKLVGEILKSVESSFFSNSFAFAFAFIPGLIASFIVKERERELRHLQIISGIAMMSYWISNFILECVLMYIPEILVFGLYTVFQIDLPYGWILLIEFPLALIPFTYLTTYLFNKEGNVFIITFFFHAIIGIFGPTVTFVFFFFESTEIVGNVLSYVLGLIPSFNCVSGLYYIANRSLMSPMLKKIRGETSTDDFAPLDWDVGLKPMAMQVVCILLYPLLLFLIETYHKRITIKYARKIVLPNYNYSYIKDNDVIREEAKVKASDPKDYAIHVNEVSKTYDKKQLAVHELTMGVKFGEVFALLGVNGAGKSTAFKMITSHLIPNIGSIKIEGYDTLNQDFEKARKLFGYSPQELTLFEHLTVKEHLQFYGRVKGIPEHLIPKLISSLLQDLALTNYENKISSKLSGGNKHKLQVAIALIGNPPIILLDEPSTGIDPKARRQMWAIVSKISTQWLKCATLLSTHSMEEAEALSTRLGIMVNGTMRCIGSCQHIKNKYGVGYEIEIKIKIPTKHQILQTIPPQYQNTFPTRSEIDSIFENEGIPNLKEDISPDGDGSDIFMKLLVSERVPIDQVYKYIIIKTNADQVYGNCCTYFKTVQVLDHHIGYFKLKVAKGMHSIGSIFGFIEDLKKKFEISDYSMAQSSLAQIFHQFALLGEKEIEGKVFQLNLFSTGANSLDRLEIEPNK